MVMLARPRRPLSILVVDDSRDAADTLAQILQTVGHEARVAYDADAALRAAAANPPDVVVLDVGTRPSTGCELARRLAPEGPRRPVLVALTGYAREGLRDDCRRGGFDLFVPEPYDPAELLGLLHRHVVPAT
jgi:CheY-like chemotaxis protein